MRESDGAARMAGRREKVAGGAIDAMSGVDE